MSGQRIEYIDAMRGFTMILVVFSHVCFYCLGNRWMGYNDVFFLFRLPCFFFISGWLFYKPDTWWNKSTILGVTRKKFRVQIIPTFIFLLLLAPPPLFFSRLGATKGGYWFTFALFEFFVLYMLSARLFRKWHVVLAVVVSAAAYCYDVFYNRLVSAHLLSHEVSLLLGFLGFITWRYYVFFFLGALVRQHFDVFISWIVKPAVILSATVLFALVACQPRSDSVFREYMVFVSGGVFGVVLLFIFFRSFAGVFSKERFLGRHLQLVGTRTLDIYLLHYFFLPRLLLPYGALLLTCESKPLEFVVAMVLSVLVVAVCLLVSRVIRLSPFLAYYLFGAQRKSN